MDGFRLAGRSRAQGRLVGDTADLGGGAGLQGGQQRDAAYLKGGKEQELCRARGAGGYCRQGDRCTT